MKYLYLPVTFVSLFISAFTIISTTTTRHPFLLIWGILASIFSCLFFVSFQIVALLIHLGIKDNQKELITSLFGNLSVK